jgi:glutamate dehydrogenase/leucine dehydrogenase
MTSKSFFEALDQNGKPFGWVVIDSLVNRHAHGGLRISPNVSLQELQDLAYKMTLKFGYVGIANGGAKAGIIGNPEGSVEERMALLRKFSDAIQPVKHTFFPHADMGTTRAEINEAFGKSDRRKEPSREQSGFFTASSVVICASVAANHLGKQMNELTAAIEGFGKVGSAVASFLQQLGVRIVAVSTSRGAIFNNNGLNISELIRSS